MEHRKKKRSIRRMLKLTSAWGTGLTMAFFLSGCLKHEKPNMTYMPDMHYSPAVKAQEEGGMRMPVEGTIPRGFTPYEYAGDPEGAGKNLRNPLPPTRASYLRGQKMFNIYCIVCHGPQGEGNGYVVPFFPQPPSLQSTRVRDFPDGRIFHIMTEGQNLMPSYASQVDVNDRWAIVYYLRALYRAKHPSASDLKRAENW